MEKQAGVLAVPYFSTATHDRLYYEAHGDHGPVVVLMHGLASSTRIWNPQIPELSRDYRIYCFDFPGHGESCRAQRYSMEDITDVLFDFLNQMHIERAYLVGLSLGCSIALMAAIREPDRIAAIILEGPVGGMSPPWSVSWLLYHLAITAYQAGLWLALHVLGKNLLVKWINQYGLQTFGYYVSLDAMERKVDTAAVRDLSRELVYPPYNRHLEQVVCPVFMIRGLDDPFPRPLYAPIGDQVSGPCEKITISGARHIVALEQPAEFNRAVRQFVDRIEAKK